MISRMVQRFRLGDLNDGIYTKDDGHSIYILVLGISDMYIENMIRTVVTWKKCKIIP